MREEERRFVRGSWREDRRDGVRVGVTFSEFTLSVVGGRASGGSEVGCVSTIDVERFLNDGEIVIGGRKRVRRDKLREGGEEERVDEEIVS